MQIVWDARHLGIPSSLTHATSIVARPQYLEEAFGEQAFLRLDGNTNRIIREMNVRIAFLGKEHHGCTSMITMDAQA